MSSRTQLDDLAIRQIASAFELGYVRDWRPVAAGTINTNYALHTEVGAFFLRVNEGKSLSEVLYEVAVVEHWAANEVPTPLPLLSQAGTRFVLREGKYISVFPWLPGSQVDSMTIGVSHCQSLGRHMARLHRTGRQANGKLQVDSRYSESHLRELFETIATSEDPVLAKAIALLREELEWLASQSATRASLERGLIHGDLFPDNVLIEGDTIVWLLDFEQACYGTLIGDLAVAVNSWCFAEAFEPARMQALLEGYCSELGIEGVDKDALHIELRASAARFTITRISDVYLPGLKVQGKDFRRFLMRLAHWRAQA